MMIVIKATLRDETRRLTFESHGFPPYEDVQAGLRAIFNLPSGAHPFWTNVLFFPDDTKPSRIKFKQHVCDAAEYEQAQQPFRRVTGYPNPALVFTVLLSSDARMNKIHDFHRWVKTQADIIKLDTDIRALEDDLTERHQLLVALEDKVDECRRQDDDVGVCYWSDRVEEKRRSLPQLEEQLRGWRVARLNCLDDLEQTRPHSAGLSLREWAEREKVADAQRTEETLQELGAWQVETGDDNAAAHSPFPPLDSVLRNAAGRPPFGGHQQWSNFGRLGAPPPVAPGNRPIHPLPVPTAIRSLFNPPENAGREIAQLLDRFLVHFQGQLVETLDDFATRIAPSQAQINAAREDVPHVPGAFVTTPPQQHQETVPVQGVVVEERKKCSGKHDHHKGGFRHKHITCDGCLTGIRGMRYKCDQCPDYDLCGTCLPLLHTEELHPPTHTFKAMLHRGLEERIKFGGTEPTRTAPQSAHHPATCDVCEQNIVGLRWKCLNCPDWDCCSACAKSVATTHPGHSFVKLHRATDYVSSTADAMSNVTHTSVICDGCNTVIRGARFKCMHPSCPDYDLCERCESAPGPVHPEDHPMLKTKTPLRVKVQSSFDPIVEVYDDHNRRYRMRKTAPSCHASSSASAHSCGSRTVASAATAATAATGIRKTSASAATSTSTLGTPSSAAAYQRGIEYGKAFDKLMATMENMSIAGSEIRVPGGYVISKASSPPPQVQQVNEAAIVKTEEEEMAALARPLAPAPAPSTPKPAAVPVAPTAPTVKHENTPVTPAPVAAVSSSPMSAWKTPEPVTFKASGPIGRPFAQTTPTAPIHWICEACHMASPTASKECMICETAKPTAEVQVEKETVKEDPIAKIIAAATEPEAVASLDPITKIIADAVPPATKEPNGPTDIFTYVRHATIPPGTRLPAGAEFTKTWTVRHYANGSDFDFGHLKLVHKTDGVLGRYCKPSIVVHREDVVNGEDAEVKVEGLIVPDQPGAEIMEMWRFEDENGVAYGQPLRVRISVEDSHSSEGSMASSSSSFVLPAAAQVVAAAAAAEAVVAAESPSAATAELSDRVSSLSPSTIDGDEDDASSTFSFSDVEHDPVVVAPPQTISSRDSSEDLSDEYDFVDEEEFDAGATTEDGF